MKITIDLSKLHNKKLTVNQYLLLLSIYYRRKNINIDFKETKSDYLYLRDNGYLVIDGSAVTLQNKTIKLIEGTSDRDFDKLAEEIRELFPKGAKGGKYPWRSSAKELAIRLQKLEKTEMLQDFSDEDILKTTEQYINKFTIKDMDGGMQISKYFIEKDGSSALVDLLNMSKEEVKYENKSMNIKL